MNCPGVVEHPGAVHTGNHKRTADMQMQDNTQISNLVTTTRSGINDRAEKAERISNALIGITRLLEENTSRKESQGDAPFMDGFVESCLYEALELISDSMMQLASEIDELGRNPSSDKLEVAA